MPSQSDNAGPTPFADSRTQELSPARVDEHIQSAKRQLLLAEAAVANARRIIEALERSTAASAAKAPVPPAAVAPPADAQTQPELDISTAATLAGAPAAPETEAIAAEAAPAPAQPALISPVAAVSAARRQQDIPAPPAGEGEVGEVRRELQNAENALAEAGSSFRNLQARELAGRIADAIRRVSCAIDADDKAAAARPAAEALAVLPALDPVHRPGEFADAAGRAIAEAARSLEGCGFPTVAYWGRTLSRLAGAFAAAGKAMVA